MRHKSYRVDRPLEVIKIILRSIRCLTEGQCKSCNIRKPDAVSIGSRVYFFSLNFWIVVRVFRAQLGLICVRQIQVRPYLSVQDIDEQCEFLDRMDFDAIFQQINLRYQ